jgi:hypothetical protein
MSYESAFFKNLVGGALPKPTKPGFGSFDSAHAGDVPASEWPDALELWLRRCSWAVFCFPSPEDAAQCAAALNNFLPPGRVEQVEGGASLLLDFRKTPANGRS